MKKTCYLIALVISLGSSARLRSADAPAAPAAEAQRGEAPAQQPNSLLEHMETLADETNRVSYAIGVNIARNILDNFPMINVEFLNLGLADVFEKNGLKMNEDYINQSIARYNEISTEHVRNKVKNFLEVNLANAERWLEQNSKKEGVTMLSSGLQYRVISPGNGPLPKPDGLAMVQYHGRNLKGATVESTLVGAKKGPATIKIAEALPFWKEVLPKMALGAKWELYVHPKLAYGDKGSETVAPNELVIYSAEIVGMQ